MCVVLFWCMMVYSSVRVLLFVCSTVWLCVLLFWCVLLFVGVWWCVLLYFGMFCCVCVGMFYVWLCVDVFCCLCILLCVGVFCCVDVFCYILVCSPRCLCVGVCHCALVCSDVFWCVCVNTNFHFLHCYVSPKTLEILSHCRVNSHVCVPCGLFQKLNILDFIVCSYI